MAADQLLIRSAAKESVVATIRVYSLALLLAAALLEYDNGHVDIMLTINRDVGVAKSDIEEELRRQIEYV
mgnify:CR=1 FL=1